jgi:hypothetical protein
MSLEDTQDTQDTPVKIILLKSGEDIIAHVEEMTIGEGDDIQPVGLRLTRPCIVKLMDGDKETKEKKKGFKIRLYPWQPLSADLQSSISYDWVVTINTPVTTLHNMYVKEVLTD